MTIKEFASVEPWPEATYLRNKRTGRVMRCMKKDRQAKTLTGEDKTGHRITSNYQNFHLIIGTPKEFE